MLFNITVCPKTHLDDCVGRNISHKIQEALGIHVQATHVAQVFTVEGLDKAGVERAVAEGVLHDPVLHDAFLTPPPSQADYVLEVGFRPGVTDNVARTARETLGLVLGGKESIQVYTALQYHFHTSVDRAAVERIAADLLANALIQRYSIKSKAEWQAEPGFAPVAARVTGAASNEVAVIPLASMSDSAMEEFSKANTLALSLEEMHAVRAHYAQPDVQAARRSMGLPENPTDAEIEVLAQTWSEHCKHKIFSAAIQYENKETGRHEFINSLYKTCIQRPTAMLRQQMGENDYCRSVFKDNAGVVAFTDSHDVCIKVETHNSPSALDPYGGALTGIVGVNRDPMGTGMGAELVCNMDVFCFASPFYEGELPPRLLHPRRVMEGVREGVEHGGNKSGVPTVNGSVVFHERFLGKPLVYCGTVGMLPRMLHGKPGHEKKANPGDAIVMVGGRIGKDGIHGATFSSEELHEGSPVTAVQIGDPITQRKMYDCVIRARDLGLYSAITDNGAGGLSSSVGEMAEDTGGCELDLAKAPLKYDGMKPWEILLSEAQERMTLAVPQENLAAFLALAKEMDVEATDLGRFTDSGFFHVTYAGKNVALLPMEFLHDGVPQMQLQAEWVRPTAFPQGNDVLLKNNVPCQFEDAVAQHVGGHGGFLLDMMGKLNICSKEYLIRQYDHEVKGGSVVKPLVGVMRDGPADAAVVRPLLDSEAGLVLSHGICPKFSDADTYWMMANAVDEAVRNAVAVGADPTTLAGVDNFCWCDPVQSEKTPDGKYKLAQLVRANKALEHFCLGYGVPCVSGKDSMKNDFMGGGEKISIPPTVLFSVLGNIHNVNKAVTSDFKTEGEAIFLLGRTANELAGSEAADALGLAGGAVPQVDLLAAKTRYALVYQAMQQGFISACHDLSDGGLAVALAEMALGGRLGARVNLARVPAEKGLGVAALLYSESASRLLVTVRRENLAAFQQLMGTHIGFDAALIGNVANTGTLVVAYGEKDVLRLDVEDVAEAFKATLRW